MWLVFFITLLIVDFVRHYLESKDFPPGPPRYPLVGSLPSLKGEIGSRIMLSSTKLADKYGKLMGYFMGPWVRYERKYLINLSQQI